MFYLRFHINILFIYFLQHLFLLYKSIFTLFVSLQNKKKKKLDDIL